MDTFYASEICVWSIISCHNSVDAEDHKIILNIVVVGFVEMFLGTF